MNISTVTVPIVKLMLTGMAPVNYSYLIASKLKIVERLTNNQNTEYRSRNPALTVHSYPNGYFPSDC